jgi:GNAT superfamily N-acetyltransferase
MIDISEANDLTKLEQVRKLLNAFIDWLRQRYITDIQIIDDYFDYKAFEEELMSLPGEYSPPSGRLLLALSNGQPAGCVALRKIDDRMCEMKRLFVHPQFHGKGIGRLLCEKLVAEARSIGYLSMRLDTGIKQAEAQSLYLSMGFEKIKAYYEVPKRLEESLVFMELNLAP